VLTGMLQKEFKGIFARLLAEVRENGDVSADDSLKRGAQIPDQAARAHDNSAYNPQIPDDPVAGQFER